MSITVIGDSKKGANVPIVTINPKNHKIYFNQSAYDLLSEKSGVKSEFVCCSIDTDIKDTFWVKLCNPGDSGARCLNQTNKSTKKTSRSISLVPFFKSKVYSLMDKGYFNLEWDNEIKAGKVILKSKE